MPYAVLPRGGPARRRALADDRWAALLERRPETAAAVDLQRALIGVVLATTDTLEAARPPRLSLPSRYLTAKLQAGIPALAGEPIPLPLDAMQPALLDLARVLAERAPGDATQQVVEAFEQGRLDPRLLLALSLGREQAAIRSLATRLSLGHDLVWLIADFAVAPFAHLLLETVIDVPLAATSASTAALRTVLDRWPHGYCPLCGSWPTLIEASAAAPRRLRCSFCAAAWDMPARACVYCATSGEPLQVVTPDPARPLRTVETCASCRGYTKTLDADLSLPFPLLPLADFESLDLDMLAMQRGAARPAAKSFRRR